ncbi:hypothetical protein ACQ4PT_004808 [Festuca glaucescens]
MSHAITRLRAIFSSLLCSKRLMAFRHQALMTVIDLVYKTPELKDHMAPVRGPMEPQKALPMGIGYARFGALVGVGAWSFHHASDDHSFRAGCIFAYGRVGHYFIVSGPRRDGDGIYFSHYLPVCFFAAYRGGGRGGCYIADAYPCCHRGFNTAVFVCGGGRGGCSLLRVYPSPHCGRGSGFGYYITSTDHGYAFFTDTGYISFTDHSCVSFTDSGCVSFTNFGDPGDRGCGPSTLHASTEGVDDGGGDSSVRRSGRFMMEFTHLNLFLALPSSASRDHSEGLKESLEAGKRSEEDLPQSAPNKGAAVTPVSQDNLATFKRPLSDNSDHVDPVLQTMPESLTSRAENSTTISVREAGYVHHD